MDEDKQILDEIHSRKDSKSFRSVINRSRFSRSELDDIMGEV